MTVATISIRSRSRPAGLGMAELLISLAICAGLLTAVAAAFHSTTMAIEVNDRFFRASQTARVAMTQMTYAVRTSDAAQVGLPNQQSLNFINDAANLDLITEDGRQISYVFDAPSRTLSLVRTDEDGNQSSYVLARDVASATFDGVIEPHPDTGVRRLVNVGITLVVEVGNQRLLLSGSAIPRRELVY